MSPRPCWCGHPHLEEFSADYRVCRACGTLVSLAPARADRGAADEGEFYGKDYWLRRQSEHHRLPDLAQRARLDLPERCTHWLRHLLRRRSPPGRVLEVGCGHGGYLALLGWAGFEAVGTEMSPWVVDFARRTFGVQAHAGRIETVGLPAASFDAIVLNDVLEHLPDPLGTLRHCAGLLAPGGFFVVQTPEYREHLTEADLRRTGDLFLKHMDGNSDEHLYLFSRRSAGELFRRLGCPALEFANPVYAYDQFFTASPAPLPVRGDDALAAALTAAPSGRLVLALLDKAFESEDRAWAIRRLGGQA